MDSRFNQTSQDYIQMANNYLKMCSRTSVTGEDKLKPQYIPPHKIKNADLGFPGGSGVKNPPACAGDSGLTPGLGRCHMPRSS